MRTYVAVDGGMSDNLRPMLYGARYEAVIADRAGATAETLATIAGMHCESGDVLVRDTELAGPSFGDVLVTPATGAYGYAMAEQLQRRAPAPGDLLPRRRRQGRGPPRDLGRPARRGTSDGRDGERRHPRQGDRRRRPSDAARGARRRWPRRSPGGGPEVSRRAELEGGGLRRDPGGSSEIVVELIGGIDPALDYVSRARCGRASTWSRPTSSCWRSTATSWWRPRARADAQLRFEAAVAGASP